MLVEPRTERNVVGILGGMGPLSSAEFLKTIYEHSSRRFAREQEAPTVAVYSDPAFPDRTTAFLRGEEEVVLARLADAITRLCAMGASRVVLCCMTIHLLVPRLPRGLRERVISLPDVIIDHVARGGGRKHLLLCSTGSHRLGLFQNHPRWPSVAAAVVFPDAADQDRLHELIYEIKKGLCLPETLSFLESLLEKYGVDSYIAACSEIHMLAKHADASPGHRARYGCVDPFTIIARELTEERQ